MTVGSEKTIDKETSSFIDEFQSNSKSRCHQNATTKSRVSSALRLLHLRIEMNEATEESASIVHSPIHGSATVIGIEIVRSSFATLMLDLVHHEQTNLMLELMLCNTRQRKEALKESRQCTGDQRSQLQRPADARNRRIVRKKDKTLSSDNTAAVWKE